MNKTNCVLPFLDTFVNQSDFIFLTPTYRKPNFIGLNNFGETFCTKQRKSNFIKTLAYRGLLICSKTKINSEIEFIKNVFGENGYSLDIIESDICTKMTQFEQSNLSASQNSPVYLSIPLNDEISMRFAKQISARVKNHLRANLWIDFTVQTFYCF